MRGQGILERYEEALEWMHSIIIPPPRTAPPPQERTREERMAGQVAGYERMGLLAEFLGRPQDDFPSVHVGGTGGKGSTAMLIGRILEGVYPRVGVHVNPYLQIPGEKFLINGRIIPPSRFAELVFSFRDKLRAFNARHPDVRIDHRTAQVALTLLYFSESELDVAIHGPFLLSPGGLCVLRPTAASPAQGAPSFTRALSKAGAARRPTRPMARSRSVPPGSLGAAGNPPSPGP